MRHTNQRLTFSLGHWAAIAWIGSAGLISCAAGPTGSLDSTAARSSPESAQVVADPVQSSPQGDSSSSSDSIARSQAPQLIKTAQMTLRVDDVEQSLDQISNILEREQGDLLNLEDQPGSNGDRDVYTLQLRIPQGNFDRALTALENLGTVKRRSIKAQDVSEQIVDAQARLKNLRKSEEMVLGIMERSGSIPDVLSASKELSTIRENIERIDAQVQNLKTRVAFSTINLRIESATVSVEVPTKVGTQLQEAWKRSTSAMGSLTMALLKLGIWGVAFSPYLVGLGLLIWLRQKYKASHSSDRTEAIMSESDSTS